MAIAHMPDFHRKLRVLIADDHPVILQRVKTVLESYPGFDVCGEATDGGKAVDEALRLKPDVVVLNVSMPVLSGFEAAREIRSSLPGSAIVILSSNADAHFVAEAKRVGAHAYVAKTKIGQALIKAIVEAVECGNFALVD
jgi:two-component system, NarL family, nitrate/nitrite response regulator NarL